MLSLILSITSCQPQESNHNTPKQTYDIIYKWLLQEGTLKNGTELGYTYAKENTTIYVKYDSSSDNIISFIMSFPDYDGNKMTLYYSISDKESNEKTYTVSLESRKNRAFARNSYSYSPSEFINKSPVKSDIPYTNKGSFISTSSTPYTEEEIQDGLNLCEKLNDIHYDAHLSFLDWLKDNFCPDLGLTIKDFGFLKYQ